MFCVELYGIRLHLLENRLPVQELPHSHDKQLVP